MSTCLLFAAAFAVSAYGQDNHKYGELIVIDHFERNESQETKDEPGNGWSTSSDPEKNGAKNVDLRDGTLHIATPKGAGHGISVRHGFSFKDGTVSVRVKLQDKKDRLRLNFADVPPENVGVNHLGAKHLFDAIITLDRISFEDKIGGVLSPGIVDDRRNRTLSKEQKSSWPPSTKRFVTSWSRVNGTRLPCISMVTKSLLIWTTSTSETCGHQDSTTQPKP